MSSERAAPAAPTASLPPRARGRWAMLAAVWGVYAGFGLVAGSLAPVVADVQADLGLSKSAMGLVLGAWQLVYLVSAVPTGAFIRRVGLRWSVALSAVVVCASGMLRAGAGGFGTLYAAVALFGFGGPLISIGAPQLIGEWFDATERRTAVGVYTTAPSVGMMFAMFTANGVFVPLFGSWRPTLVLYGAMAGVTGLVWLSVSATVGARSRRPVDSAAAGAAAALGSRALLRLPVVRLVLVLAVGSFLFSHALGNWMVRMLQDGGRSAATAGTLAAFTTLVGIGATAVVPRLATAERRVALLVGVYLLGAVAVAGMTFVTGSAVLGLLIGLGIARASSLPMAMLVLMDAPEVGPRNMAAAGGLYFTAGEVGGVLGPLLVGVVADASGGFRAPALALAVVALALAVVSLRVPRPDRPGGRAATEVPG